MHTPFLRNKVWSTLSVVLLVTLLAGCGANRPAAAPAEPATPRELTISKNSVNQDRTECKGNLDYLDGLMLNDIHYAYFGTVQEHGEGVPPELVGNKIAEVAYTMVDDACSDFVMQNGDATLLPTGTAIYAMRDYDPDFRIVAQNRIFQVSENPKAKTLGDLYDIEGKVLKISRVSGNDGSHMWDFSPEDTDVFISDMLSLKYVGFDEIYKNNPPEYRTSLRIHLKDGTTMEMAYWPKANALNEGAYGTKRMLDIVQKKP